MRDFPADCAGVSDDEPRVESASFKDSFISFRHNLVIFLEVFLGRMKRISVFHQKFAPAHHTETRTNFVAKLCLNLIKTKRELTVRMNFAARKVGNNFFVCRSEDIIVFVPVFKAHKFFAVNLPSSGFHPEFFWREDGHKDFLRVAFVHFFTHDVGDFADNFPAEWEVFIDTRADFSHHPRANH